MHTLLVVDDEFSILETLSEIFGYEGYEVRTARNGLQALAEARKLAPDLVLADYMMPHMDGAELARALRKEPGLRGVPIILMSAAVLPNDDVAWDTSLQKPFDLDTLLEVVARCIQRAQRSSTP